MMKRMLPQAGWMGRGSHHQFRSLLGFSWSDITGAKFSRGFFMACGIRVGTNETYRVDISLWRRR